MKKDPPKSTCATSPSTQSNISENNNYLIRLESKDGSGITIRDTSDSTFEISYNNFYEFDYNIIFTFIIIICALIIIFIIFKLNFFKK